MKKQRRWYIIIEGEFTFFQRKKYINPTARQKEIRNRDISVIEGATFAFFFRRTKFKISYEATFYCERNFKLYRMNQKV